jgi:mycothiol synthase
MTDLPESEYLTQLRMVWPEHLLDVPPSVQLLSCYYLRTYQPGDEPRFFKVMELAGWPGWNAEKLRAWRERMLPQGWFMVVHNASNEIVATAMAFRDRLEFGCQGGEMGWVACVPGHRAKGLGLAVSAAATTRLIEEGYRHIHLYTEDWRFAALKTYLRLGYIPFLYAPDMPERWRTICTQLKWPFTPEKWKS